MHLEPVLAEHLAALRALHPEIRLDEPGYDDAAIIIRASNERSAKFSKSLKVLRHFQPGKDPSRGLLRDCENFHFTETLSRRLADPLRA